ncbi:uncharacterized protein BT62DRAFT_1033969 [Guyanagaster necrorhizus]|uniref:Uncharacterized protein n=1 Tax=Guyanagaster necrorhizus TaxID=856835 RepID=A0A9P7VPK8_9AGAR|nr:uncharacterized protein BT62DRAFT_1033969 [Guyanagaster necrorhizus MCA 3950]KAG7443669.1 hypothetical protein BT62DRAFT_1033969 [Guyanagaster necrorhizus MCA 3950]
MSETAVESLSMETVLRLGTIAICTYDYVRTLPGEYKFWRDKGPQIRPKSFIFVFQVKSGIDPQLYSLVLFVLIRYISAAVLIVSNVGYFSHSFGEKSCQRYYMVPVVLKALQMTVCQLILGLRTYSISRRSQRIKSFLVVVTVIVTLLEWFTNLYGRVMIQTDGNCTSGNDPSKLVNWMFYIWAMLYDMTTLGLSTYFLVKAGGSGLSSMTGLVRAMVVDGLGYIVLLTITNTLNLILYRASSLSAQAAAATLGIAFTWIMSQNILIKTRGMRSYKNHQPSSGRTPYSRSDDQSPAAVAVTTKGIELEVQVTINREQDVDEPGVKWDDSRSDVESQKMSRLTR